MEYLMSLASEIATEEGLDKRFFMSLIWEESDWDPNCVGKNGEVGLCQITPALWASFREKYGVEYDTGRDMDYFCPSTNLRIGARHLKALIKKYGVYEALICYNAGEKWKKKGKNPLPAAVEYSVRIMKRVCRWKKGGSYLK